MAKSRRLFCVQEPVEHVGGEHGRRRNPDLHVGEPIPHVVLLEEQADERQAPRLAAERAAADPREHAPGIERVALEVRNRGAAAAVAVLLDGLEQVAPQVFVRREVGHLPRAHALRQRELGARLQPLREVVALGVVGDALARHDAQQLLERLQVARAAHLGAAGPAEDEVAESEAFDHEPPQVVQEQRRPLQQERGTHRRRQRLVRGGRWTAASPGRRAARPAPAGRTRPRRPATPPRSSGTRCPEITPRTFSR